MALEQLAVKATSETKKEWDTLLAELKEEGTVKTVGAFVELLLENYLNPKVKEVDNPEHLKRIKELETISLQQKTKVEDLQATLFQRDEKIHEYQETIEEADSAKHDLIEQSLALGEKIKQKDAEFSSFSKSKELKANQLLLEVEPVTLKLIEATASRLSKKYNKEVLPAHILLDMFNRYTIERWSEWFYPFVINPSEFKEICGYTPEQLKKWLHDGK